MARSLAASDAELGEAVTLGGAPVVGVFSVATAEDIPELGGTLSTADATFRVRKAVLPTKPRTGDPLVRAGVRYKVLEVEDGVASWLVNLEAPAQ